VAFGEDKGNSKQHVSEKSGQLTEERINFRFIILALRGIEWVKSNEF